MDTGYQSLTDPAQTTTELLMLKQKLLQPSQVSPII